MASKKFHITDQGRDDADGVIQSLDKQTIGLAWNNDGPYGTFITGQLEGYWIITDEEYKLLKEAKRKK